MSLPFERTTLWRRAFSPVRGDQHADARERLRAAYLQFRSAVEPLAGEISRSMPMFTDHSITHADALWDTASLVCGDDVPINPAEAFVVGGAFLLHDLGMGLASYEDGVDALERDPQFEDLYTIARSRLDRGNPFASSDALDRAAHDEAISQLLRLRHAEQAERLVNTAFRTSDGEPFYLLSDLVLRQSFGSIIGRVAHSHWSDVSELRRFEVLLGSSVDHPRAWEIDPLKLACVLRLADIAQIDSRRAPSYLHAFRRPTGPSRDHWYFQERLTRPRVDSDRLVYTSTRPFGRNEAAAWWLAYDTVRAIDNELRRVDALCADLGRPRFAVRSVAGADSPERLASYIRTDRWEPMDAELRVSDTSQLIANLGGVDLYGDKPHVAMRELIANGADATRARAVHEGSPVGTVTVRLSRDDRDWWLEVEDHGTGMSPEVMVSALTDFGVSHWQSTSMMSAFPRLVAKGFRPTGRFGIGFFAVFMVADEVEVRSLAYDEAPRTTHVLEFHHGTAMRPLLRVADVHERLRSSGTVVRAKLRHDPRTLDGMFKTNNTRLTHTQLLHSRLTRMCALAEVDIAVQGPDDATPVRIIQAADWRRIPPADLFRRIYRRDEASHGDRIIYDGYERWFVAHATDLTDENGNVIGRGILVSGLEAVYPDLRWMRVPEAPVYAGGLESGRIMWAMGAFVGWPLKADRMSAFLASLPRYHAWLDHQASVVSASPLVDVGNRRMLGMNVRGLGVNAPELPCANCSSGPLDADSLRAWAADRDEIYLVAMGSVTSVDVTNKASRYFTLSGGEPVDLPDAYLIVDMNPNWYIPEEICPRPRDERFAHVVETESVLDPRAWWYDTGNFGSVGLVVRTIAEAWGIDVVRAVNLMEPLHVQADGDRRPVLPTSNGTVHVAAIRMRRALPA